MHVTVVYVHVKPEHVADFVEAIRENYEHSVKEPGNLRFDILQSVEDPTRFVAYEAYRDQAAAKAHRRRPTTWPGARRSRIGWRSRGRASDTTVSSRRSCGGKLAPAAGPIGRLPGGRRRCRKDRRGPMNL